MFIDTRQQSEGTTVETTVCIIGGGVAGITIALELEKKGIACVLLESGGHEADDATRDLYRGENVGLPYDFADGCRSRFLGGSSNCWGGWCRPFEDIDFKQRDWVANSGWPFGQEEVAPYYARTHELLQLGPVNYDSAFWVKAVNRADVQLLPLTKNKIEDVLIQFSPPARFGKVYHDELSKAKFSSVYLYANVVNIETDAGGQSVKRVHVKTLSGRSISVHAKQFVLAAGGIENARLLLASNKIQLNGIGNQHDVVGRYFMDHPRIYWGKITPKDPKYRNKLFDHKFHYLNKAVAANGTYIAGNFKLKSDVQKEERVLNSQVWFSSVFPADGSAAMYALVHFKQALHRMEQPGVNLWRDFLTLLMHPIDTTAFVATRFLQPHGWVKYMKLMAISESDPHADSRIMLSDQRDALGMPRVKVDWRLSELVKRTFDRSFALASDELEAQGIWNVEREAPLEGRDWPTDMEKGTWHHMGTTRMHDSPKLGVVDRNCRVNGMFNFYIAGSSVFPTGGCNFPTIMITALALRLSEHIGRKIRQS
ncbi:MAG: GMC family oxidoreductase [Burkholderiales bacterium]